MQFAVTDVAVEEIKAWDRNPRLHDIEALKASIERFGFRNVVVVNRRTMTCEAGHGRVAAARALGLETVPVLFVEDDDDTAAAFAIADNRQSELSWWDEDKLADILQELSASTSDILDSIGYTSHELTMMLDRLDPEGAVKTFKPLTQALDVFINAEVKQMVLIFTAEEFASVQRRFADVLERESLASNVDVVRLLLERYEAQSGIEA
jgi:DNA-binding MarR family transcriptional regulator